MHISVLRRLVNHLPSLPFPCHAHRVHGWLGLRRKQLLILSSLHHHTAHALRLLQHLRMLLLAAQWSAHHTAGWRDEGALPARPQHAASHQLISMLFALTHAAVHSLELEGGREVALAHLLIHALAGGTLQPSGQGRGAHGQRH